MNPSSLKLAVVGVGPKGLFCLERLAVEAHRGRIPESLELHLFEPHRFPGAGPVYDPRQPPFLRMNFASRHVDMWSAAPEELPFPLPSLVEWLSLHHPALADPRGYIPRSVVGEYLHAGYLEVVAFLRQTMEVVLHPQTIEAVQRIGQRDGGRWRLETADGALLADEVLIATGHDSRTCPSGKLPSSPWVIPKVYPVGETLEGEWIPPGSRVALRGFGLTALDAALALTERRGGRFEPGKKASELVYRRSGLEPKVILPYSRTGRPMMPKPHFLEPTPELEEVWRQESRSLRGITAGRGETVIGPLLDALARAAGTALSLVRGDGSRERDESRMGRMCRRLVEICCGGAEEPGERSAQEALEEGLAVAFGERPPGDDWALGESWRGLYPAIVELVARKAITGAAWSSFERLAREMERLTFGPPAENAARYLALVRAGIIDLAVVENPRVDPTDGGVHLASAGEERSADLLLNAVLPPPGGAPESSPLLEGLLEDGHLRTLPWSAGIEVTAAGRCIGRDGSVTPGLSMVGRPTEGCVLGNDTLSRKLHSAPARWAQSVLAELSAPVEKKLPAVARR